MGTWFTKSDGTHVNTDNGSSGITKDSLHDKGVDVLGNPVSDNFEDTVPLQEEHIVKQHLTNFANKINSISRENKATKNAQKDANEVEKERRIDESNRNMALANAMIERAEAIQKGESPPPIDPSLLPEAEEAIRGTKPYYKSEKEIEMEKKANAKDSVKEERIIAGMQEQPKSPNPLFPGGKPTAAYGRPPVQTQEPETEQVVEQPKTVKRTGGVISLDDALMNTVMG